MAQECMGIFEKDKLSQIANVEQVPPFHLLLLFGLSNSRSVLRNRNDCRGQISENVG